jgi:hypothetical protein
MTIVDDDIYRFLTTDLPTVADLIPAHVTYEETHSITTTPRYYLTHNLDIRGLEMRLVDMLVSQIYTQAQFHSSQAAFCRLVLVLCEIYRTLLFNASNRAFYTLVVNTFEAHPARYQMLNETYSFDLLTVAL